MMQLFTYLFTKVTTALAERINDLFFKQNEHANSGHERKTEFLSSENPRKEDRETKDADAAAVCQDFRWNRLTVVSS